MKSVAIKVSIACLVFFVSNNLLAQNTVEEKRFKNEVSFLLTDLLDGSYHFRYERSISSNFSAILGVGFKGEDGIVKLSGIDRDFIKTNNLTYSGVRIVPELRYYVNNCTGSLTGFYVGAFAKISRYKSDFFGNYINENDETFMFDYDAEIDITSFGFMIGYKLKLLKRFTMDFIIAGPGIGSFNYKLKRNLDVPDGFYDRINDAINNHPLFDIINADVVIENRAESENSFTAYAFRYGVSLGYRF